MYHSTLPTQPHIDAYLRAGRMISAYDSVESRQLAQEVLALINYTSKLASVELARTRGACPAVLDGLSRYANPAFLRRFAELEVDSVTRGEWAALADHIASTGLLRNSSTTAIPPTGRSASVVRASTGIEPLFRLSDDRPGRHRADVAAVLEAAGRADLLGFVADQGRLPDDPTLPERLRAVLATATEISPAGHLAMAAAVQSCVDEAVSKTVNLPASARPIDVYNTYVTAFELGCKGITVYVDGSRSVQPQALATAAVT